VVPISSSTRHLIRAFSMFFTARLFVGWWVAGGRYLMAQDPTVDRKWRWRDWLWAAREYRLPGPWKLLVTTPVRYGAVVADQIELSPTDWVREQTEKILKQGTTDGVEILDRPVILVTVTGSKSGKQRYVPLMRVEKDGRYAMVASKGGAPAHPSWYFNVKANPAVTVQDGDKVTALRARELEGSEREQWWRLAVEAYPPYAEYQMKTARQIPVFVLE
jgi:deazaflavin-dependent oxidoreductase (nitroreductase family)